MVVGRRISLILAVPADTPGTQNQSVFTLSVRLPAEQGEQGFSSLSEQSPSLLSVSVQLTSASHFGVCGQSVLGLRVRYPSPTAAARSEADQYPPCTCVYSEQTFASFSPYVNTISIL